MITGGDLRQSRLDVGYKTFTISPWIYSKDLIETIFMQPYTKISFLVDAGIAKRQTASRYLQTLASMGILREELVGREKYYINDGLLVELTR